MERKASTNFYNVYINIIFRFQAGEMDWSTVDHIEEAVSSSLVLSAPH